MTKIKTGIPNWIGKAILMAIATVWLVSDVYDNILSNFFLTEREVVPWGTAGDYGVLAVTASLILGGWYLNAILAKLGVKPPKEPEQ